MEYLLRDLFLSQGNYKNSYEKCSLKCDVRIHRILITEFSSATLQEYSPTASFTLAGSFELTFFNFRLTVGVNRLMFLHISHVHYSCGV